METLSYKNVEARKEHKCNFCGGIISKGETYLYSAHVDGGEFYTWKSHSHCSALVSYLDMDYDNEGVTPDSFVECVRQATDYYDDEELKNKSIAELAKSIVIEVDNV